MKFLKGKRIAAFLLALVLTFTSFGSDLMTISAYAKSNTGAAVTLTVGETKAITVEGSGYEVTDKDWNWSSNNNSVATVGAAKGPNKKDATITAVSAGTATITATRSKEVPDYSNRICTKKHQHKEACFGKKTTTDTYTVNVSVNATTPSTPVTPSGDAIVDNGDGTVAVGTKTTAAITWKRSTVSENAIINNYNSFNWNWDTIKNIGTSVTDIKGVWDGNNERRSNQYIKTKLSYDFATWQNQNGWDEKKSIGEVNRFRGTFNIPAGYNLSDSIKLAATQYPDKFPINDDVFVFVYKEGETLTNDNYLNYLAFFTGTSGGDGNTFNFHGKTSTKAHHNGSMKETDGWYCEAVTDNIGKILYDNYSASSADTTFVIDVFAVDFNTAGGMDKLDIEFTKNASASVTVEYYKDSLDSTPIETVTAKNLTVGSTYTVELNKFKPEGYKDGVIAAGSQTMYQGSNTIKVLYEKNEPVSVSATGYSASYDGANHGGSVTAAEGATLSYSWTENGEVKTSSTAPEFKDAGTYTVTVTASKAGYLNNETSYNVVITKKNITLTTKNASKSYDGSKLALEFAETGDGFATGEGFETISYLTEVGPNVTSGTNEITYTLKSNTKASNYNIVKSEGTYAITKATLTITYDGETEKYYDGTALGSAVTVKDSEGNVIQVPVVYTIDGVRANDVPTITEVGVLAVSANIESDNYEADECEYELEVTAAIMCINDASVEADYDGTAHGEKPVVVDKDGREISRVTLTYEVKNENGVYEAWTGNGEYPTLTNAGKLEVKVTATHSNYGTETSEYVIKVNAPKLVLDDVDDVTGLTYNGVAQGALSEDPAVTAVVNEDTVDITGVTYTYTYTSETTGETVTSATAPSFVNAGEHAVSVTASKANYETSDAVEYKVVIDKFKVTVTLGDAVKTYGEADPTVETTLVPTVEGTTIPAGANIPAVVTIGSHSETAGTYEGIVTVSNGNETVDSNYEVDYSDTTDLVINKKETTFTIDTLYKYFSENDPALTGTFAEGTILAADADKVNPTITREAGENKGEYSYEVSFPEFAEANYDITVVNENDKFEIKALPVKVVVAGNVRENVPYNGGTYEVSGYTVTAYRNDAVYEAYTEDKLVFTGKPEDLKITMTARGQKVKDLNPEDFSNTDENYDVTIETTPLKMTVVRGTSMELSLVGGEFTYDGNRHYFVPTVTGATGTTTIYVQYAWVGRDGKEHWSERTVWDNNSKEDLSVLNVSDGTVKVRMMAENRDYYGTKWQEATLKINPLSVDVTVYGKRDTFTYDGKEHIVNGAEYKISNNKLSEKEIRYNGSLSVAATNAGTTYMNLSADNFSVENTNFNVNFSVERDGYVTITKRDVTVAITGNSKNVIYNGEEQSVTGYTASTRDTVLDKSKITYAGDAIAKGTNASDKPYMMKLDASKFGYEDADNFNVTFRLVKDGSLTIGKSRENAVIANDINVTYDGAAHFGVATAKAAGSEVYYSVNGGRYTKTVPSRVDAGTTVVDVKVTNPNYYDAYGSFKINVAKKNVTFTIAEGQHKTYGTLDPRSFEGSFAQGDIERGDNVTAVIYRAWGEDAGKYEMNVSLGGKDLKNYNVKVNKANFVIDKKNATFHINKAEKTYGDKDPFFTGYFTGIYYYDVLGVGYYIERADERNQNVGEYALSARFFGLRLKNYNITVDNTANLVIKPAKLVVTAKNQTVTYGDTTLPVLENASDYYDVKGLKYRDTKAVIEASVETEIEKLPVGYYEKAIAVTGEATQGNYTVEYKEGNLTVVKKAASYEVDEEKLFKIYDGEEADLTDLATLTGILEGDDVTIELVKEEGVTAGEYEVTVVISGEDADNYDFGNIETYTYIIDAKHITVKVNDATKTFGDADPEFSLVFEDGALVGEDELFYTFSREEGENVGKYAIYASFLMDEEDDEVIEYPMQEEIRPLALLEEEVLEEVFDNGEAIIAKAYANRNYEVEVEAGELTITKRHIVIKANDAGKRVGEADPNFTTTITNAVDMDPVQAYAWRYDGEGVGKYGIAVTVTRLSDNYDAEIKNGTFTIYGEDEIIPVPPTPTPTVNPVPPTEVIIPEEEVPEVGEISEVAEVAEVSEEASEIVIPDEEVALAAPANCYIHWIILAITLVYALYAVLRGLKNAEELREENKELEN